MRKQRTAKIAVDRWRIMFFGEGWMHWETAGLDIAGTHPGTWPACGVARHALLAFGDFAMVGIIGCS